MSRDIPFVAVINLDRDTARLEQMRIQLQRLGISWERFAAIRGDALPDALKRYFPHAGEPDFFLSRGEVGCYASHLALHQRMLEGSLPAPLLVLEDDVGLPADFDDLLMGLAAVLPPNWDIVRLSNTVKNAYVATATLPSGRALVRCSIVPGSTGAYLISASGARKFLAERERALPVDQDLRRVWVWDLNTFVVTPPPIAADVHPTSSIDALTGEAQRSTSKRLKKLRRGRAAETMARMAWNRRMLGTRRWAGCALGNAIVRLVPKRARARFLSWLSGALETRRG